VAAVERQLAFRLALFALGVAGFIVAALGEFVYGWWR
jgi:hypothetical protein